MTDPAGWEALHKHRANFVNGAVEVGDKVYLFHANQKGITINHPNGYKEAVTYRKFWTSMFGHMSETETHIKIEQREISINVLSVRDYICSMKASQAMAKSIEKAVDEDVVSSIVTSVELEGKQTNEH